MAPSTKLFLSHASGDKTLADQFRAQLEAAGFAVRTVDNDSAEEMLDRQVEQEVKSSDAIVLLVASDRPKDRAQDLEWQLALEAKWEDESKPLIPVVVGEIELPTFFTSAAAGGELQGVRLTEPGDLAGAAREVARIAGSRLGRRRGKGVLGAERGVRGAFDLAVPGEGTRLEPFSVPGSKGGERQSRLAEIAAHADSLLEQ